MKGNNMKRLSLLTLLLGLVLQATATGMSVTGLVTDKNIKKLYLFIVEDEHYGYVQPVDSFKVEDGSFTYRNDTLTTRLFFMSPAFNPNEMESCFEQGTFLFLANGNNQLSISRNGNGPIIVDNPNVKLNAQYALFKHQKDSNVLKAVRHRSTTVLTNSCDSGWAMKLSAIKVLLSAYTYIIRIGCRT